MNEEIRSHYARLGVAYVQPELPRDPFVALNPLQMLAVIVIVLTLTGIGGYILLNAVHAVVMWIGG